MIGRGSQFGLKLNFVKSCDARLERIFRCRVETVYRN